MVSQTVQSGQLRSTETGGPCVPASSEAVQSGWLRSTERRVDHAYQHSRYQHCFIGKRLPKAIMQSQSLFSISTKRKCEVLCIASENAVSQKHRGLIAEGQEIMNNHTSSDLNDAGFEEDSDPSEEFSTTSFADNIEPQTELPTCWTQEQGGFLMSLYPGQQFRKGKLGCSVCAKVAMQSLHSEVRKTRISKEWSQCLITSPFESKTGQQGALRKKIREHKQTPMIRQRKFFLEQRKRKWKKILNTSNKEDTINRIFWTAYMIGKEDRPLSDMPFVVDLQVANGLKMGWVVQSRKSCGDICYFFGEEMKKTITKDMIEKQFKFSVLIDECTTVSHLSAIAVH